MGVAKLEFPLKGKYVCMLAPSFVVDFDYPEIIQRLKELGFDKVVELTFGAKMVNREYHKVLNGSNELIISSACPGIVETIKSRFPEYENNIAKIASPMIAMARICKKTYPKHKIVFISPCNSKKIEASKSKEVDYVIDYKELKELFDKFGLSKMKGKVEIYFDKFYNDYTKVYPVSGGLSKTAHLKGIIKKDEVKVIDGIGEVIKFLEKPNKNVKFLDVTFCKGGCIGGPCVNSKESLNKRKNKVLAYLGRSKEEDILEARKGLISKANGINFRI